MRLGVRRKKKGGRKKGEKKKYLCQRKKALHEIALRVFDWFSHGDQKGD